MLRSVITPRCGQTVAHIVNNGVAALDCCTYRHEGFTLLPTDLVHGILRDVVIVMACLRASLAKWPVKELHRCPGCVATVIRSLRATSSGRN